MTNQVVFIGCGDIATRAALDLHDQNISVLGVRRNTAKLPSTLPAKSADVLNPESLTFLRSSQAETLVYCLAANAFTSESYNDAYVVGLCNTIEACNPAYLKRLIFVSSTAVYHQNDGSIVDEDSPTIPERFNGKIMLQAEKHALGTCIGTCVRFSGVYGPGRLRMIDRVRNGQCTAENTNVFTNRIHVEDCAGLLSHLVKQPKVPDIINGTDSNPVPASEIESYIADQLGINKRYSSDSARQRIAGSKRCSNQRMLDSGYQLKYPDYRSGYLSLIQEHS